MIYGFEATAGWDPASGLGSPKFEPLMEYVLEMKRNALDAARLQPTSAPTAEEGEFKFEVVVLTLALVGFLCIFGCVVYLCCDKPYHLAGQTPHKSQQQGT